jgi:hypothetical protein
MSIHFVCETLENDHELGFCPICNIIQQSKHFTKWWLLGECNTCEHMGPSGLQCITCRQQGNNESHTAIGKYQNLYYSISISVAHKESIILARFYDYDEAVCEEYEMLKELM